MYARHIAFRLKPTMQSEFIRTLEDKVLPVLRKQNGFIEEITLCSPGTVDGVAISLWESKNNADDYNGRIYPEVLKSLAKVVEGTPRLRGYEMVVSTLQVAVAV